MLNEDNLNDELSNLDRMEFIYTNYQCFFGIAARSFKKVKELVREQNSIHVTEEDVDSVDSFCIINKKIERLSMVTVVFCAMSIESFINNYLVDNGKFSISFSKKYVDKLDLKSKWVLYPILVTGNKINTHSTGFEMLGNLKNLRDRLVHDKPKRRRICDLKESDWITENDAKNAIETVREILKELKKLDNSIDIDWLETAEKDPYV